MAKKCCVKIWKKCRHQARHLLPQARHRVCGDWIRTTNKPSWNVILATYKKWNKNIETKINKLKIKFAKQPDILGKIEMSGTGNSFVTLKDHKENFRNHPATRFTNPSKNEIRRISKHILNQINTKLVSKLSTNE